LLCPAGLAAAADLPCAETSEVRSDPTVTPARKIATPTTIFQPDVAAKFLIDGTIFSLEII
jgi:hypothetical protein